MKKILTTTTASVLLAMAVAAAPHGGVYRGPGDIVPPGTRGHGMPGPKGPTGPAGPFTGRGTPGTGNGGTGSTGGPNGPGGPGGNHPVSGRGAPIGADLTRWQFWWEFNKAPYINLKQAIHASFVVSGGDEYYMGRGKLGSARDTNRPTRDYVVGSVLPALKRALDSTDQRDIVSSCLVAMAKIGCDHEDFRILELMAERLRSREQEIRETAALAMGISQLEGALAYLPDLARSTEAGAKLVDRAAVDHRTRAFACYGLGLVAHATADAGVKRRCFEALRDVLQQCSSGEIVDRNIPVAAIHGIRLVRPDRTTQRELLGACVDTLWSYYQQDEGKARQRIQAHVPPAVAQLLGRGGDGIDPYREALLAELADPERSAEIHQSAVVALGLLARPAETGGDDARCSAALRKHAETGKDAQSRYFALMALGKIGGDQNRSYLLQALDRGSKALVKPWAALALGVLAHEELQRADGAAPDSTIGHALHRMLTSVKNDETQAAIAIALGLCRHEPAAPQIEELLRRYRARDDFAGYLCISLALMGHDRSLSTIRTLVESSVRRPQLLKQAAIALGKLGDRSAALVLQEMLEADTNQNVAKLGAVSSALGFIGDKRSIDPLVKMLHNESITPLSRAFAAVALGGVADKEPLPWNSKLAVDMNYRAAVETLTNQMTGVLDIL